MLLFFNTGGEVVDQAVGLQTKEELTHKVNKLL
jgi:hypothetical protein